MKYYLNLLALLFCVILLTPSCGSDDGVDCEDTVELNRIVEDGLDRVLDVTFDYSNDPSNENCNRLKSVYSDWIDEMERLQDCADQAGQGAEYREAINEARSALNDIPC